MPHESSEDSSNQPDGPMGSPKCSPWPSGTPRSPPSTPNDSKTGSHWTLQITSTASQIAFTFIPVTPDPLLQRIIQRIWPLTNDHLEDPASCKWSSKGSSLLQIIIRPLTNDHPEDPASCKWSTWGSGSCKWSSRGSSLLQMIIRRIWPLANDHTEDLASCKWSSEGTGLLQMIILNPRHPNHLSQDPD